MKRLLFLVLCVGMFNCLLPNGVSASEMVVRDDLAKHFQGLTGTFVLFDPQEDKYVVYNQLQSQKRISPCSTFKIYHSLIGLQTEVLDQEDSNTLVRWDGKIHSILSWNRDQTLASATRDSVVWYFQQLAARIGQGRMQEYIDKIGYGNRDISGWLTFWLGSSLQISAMEQVDLLNRLYAGKLPFLPENIEIVKKNITVSESGGVRLMGKTGSGYEDANIMGWFVGCVEKEGHYYVFATNIENSGGAYGAKAREITKGILQEMGIL